jgi:hypothetical protein
LYKAVRRTANSAHRRTTTRTAATATNTRSIGLCAVDSIANAPAGLPRSLAMPPQSAAEAETSDGACIRNHRALNGQPVALSSRGVSGGRSPGVPGSVPAGGDR